MRIKKTLQPIHVGEYIYFGYGQDSIERKVKYSTVNENVIKHLNDELKFEDLNMDISTFNEKLYELEQLGVITKNNYDNERYSRNINFFEWIDTSSNLEPIIYQEKIKNTKIFIVGLGGIGSNVADILVRMGVQNIIILDSDVVDKSNLTRQGTYFENDLNNSKSKILYKYLKNINNNVDIKHIENKIDSIKELEFYYQHLDFDLAICCADKPKYTIDSWFDSLSIKYNKPYVVGSYASTCINSFCVDTNYTKTSSEIYATHGSERKQLLENLDLPTSVIAPVTYMAAGLIAYKVFTYITGLNYKEEAVQIDLLNWEVERYDIRK